MQPKRILVLGGLSYNLMVMLESFPQPHPQTIFSHSYHEMIGSTGAGKALNLQKLGFDVTLHALIGQDEYGEKLKQTLAQTEINFVYDIDPKGTKRHLNLMDAVGGRISIFLESGTFKPNLDLTRLSTLIANCDLIVLNIINHNRQLIPIIQQHNKPIWCDIHDYDGKNPYHQDFIEAADVLFMSSDNMPNYEPFMQEQAKQKQLVVCTHGKEGATAVLHDPLPRTIHIPAITDYQLVDSNGAGDAFFSGLLLGYAQNKSLKESLQYGTIVGGMCISVPQMAHPDLSAINLQTHYQKQFGLT